MTSAVKGRKTAKGAQPLAAAHGVAQREITHASGSAGGVTPSLLAAALSGLLCLSGCGSDEPSLKKPERDASAGDPGNDAAAGGDAAVGAPTQDAAMGGDAAPGEPTHDAGGDLAPDAGAGDAAMGEPEHDPNPHITHSRVDETVTEASFREQCEELNGTLELHPSCGGANSCRGMSYDIDTHVYTEHTCKGLNTCRGFSCVLPQAT